MSASASDPRTRNAGTAYFYAGLFLLSGAVLMLQLIQTRILSVSTWYHLAFFVISMAMFGLTAGAVAVYLRGDFFSAEHLSYRLSQSTMAFAVSIPLGLMLQFSLLTTFAVSLSAVVVFGVLALCLAVPFFFGGVVVSLCLTRSPYPVGRVYGADLLGAGGGCLLALAFMNWIDGPSAVLGTAVVVALAGVCFGRSGLGTRPREAGLVAGLLERRGALLVLLVVATLANSLTHHGLQPIFIKHRVETYGSSLEFLEWNAFSRIAAYRSEHDTPKLWGPSPKLPKDVRVDQRFLNIDGLAGTAMYRFDDVRDGDFLKYDVTNLAYFLPDRDTAAIIGVGGGRDVVSAWKFGKKQITGVEINPIFVRLHTTEPDFASFSGLQDLDNVELVVDEARSWFARTDRRFDVIQMSLIDTWAATGSGAFTLSENGLYTTEGWGVILDRLQPGGVFTVSRWFGSGAVNETGRMISLAVASLLQRGAESPRDHVFVAAIDNIATLIVSNEPLSPADVAALHAATTTYGYEILASPDRRPDSPVLAEILAATSLEALHAYTSSLALDMTPPDDDRPFFFNQLRFDRPMELVRLVRSSSPGVILGNLIATATLSVILLVSAVLVVATIVLPLRFSIRDVTPRLRIAGTAYFLLIGVGFMMAEIALMQRCSVFLGHPVYALGVVLFTIIVATGLGSLLSDRMPLESARRFTAWALLAGVYLASLSLWLPDVFQAVESQALGVRVAVCIGVILPAGLLLGFGFPTGMRLAAAVDPQPTPWLWGVNGAAGVMAGGLAVITSMTLGISGTLLIAGLCYVALIPAARGIGWTAKAAA